MTGMPRHDARKTKLMKPALTLHIGHRKTGSTTLQNTLAASAPALLERGVLYPHCLRGASHSWLVMPLDFVEKGPRLMRQRLGFDAGRAQATFDREWANLVAQVDAARPAQVILSTEYLVDRLTPELAPAFRDRLQTVFGDITVVVYVRQPSRWAFSNLQQHLRYQDDLPPVEPLSVRPALEVWEAAFPGRLIVRPHDRAQLVQGDIVADFLSHGAGIAPGSVTLTPGQRTNEGMTPEAAQLMQDFRSAVCPGHVGRHLASSNFYAALRRADAEDTPAGPVKLRPGLAEWLDLSCTELLWLKDRFDLSYPGIDLAAVGPRPPLPGPFVTVRDVAVLDEARLDRLRRTAFRRVPWLRALMAWRSRGRARGQSSLRT